MKIEIQGAPVPWAPARYLRHGISYSPKSKDKKRVIWEVKKQYSGECFKGPVHLEFCFYMPIPKSWSKKKQAKVLSAAHTNKPDTTNLQKFAEDCLKGIVFEDDKQVWSILSQKVYSDNPRTVIYVLEINSSSGRLEKTAESQ